jgi:hypothetical protein
MSFNEFVSIHTWTDVSSDETVPAAPAQDAEVESYTVIDNTGLQMKGLSLEATGLYSYLHSMCFGNRTICWPSLSHLEERFRATRRTILKARDELIKAGLLEYTPGTGRRSNSYKLVLRDDLLALRAHERKKKIKEKTIARKQRQDNSF